MITICTAIGCKENAIIVDNSRKVYSLRFCKKHCGLKFKGKRKKTKKKKSGLKSLNKIQTMEIGTRYVNKDGYVNIKTENGIIAEHTLIMQQKLGRSLYKWESVHHKNGIRDDNSPDNLELWLGGIRYGQRAHEVTCPHCGKFYNEN